MHSDTRLIFYTKLFNLGFKLIELQIIDEDGDCTCPEGAACRNPGKHPVAGQRLGHSIFSSPAEALQHLDNGGGVGLAIWYKRKPLNTPPLQLVVFDCDDLEGEPWLEARGVFSKVKVRGRRGVHIYCLIPEGLPLFKSNTTALRPEFGTPRIDVKTSGLIVLPWSPNKRLEICGREVTDDPEAVAALLNSLEDFAANLPLVDPRMIVPSMAIRDLELAGSAKYIYLSRSHPKPGEFSPSLVDVHYGERVKLASHHAFRSATPSIQGQKPRQALFKLVANLRRMFGLSEKDIWCVVKESYNHRCLDSEGKSYPWKKAEVAQVIREAKARNAFSSLEEAAKLHDDWVQPDLSKTLERQRRRGRKANDRRQARRQEAQSRCFGIIEQCLQEGGVEIVDGMQFKPTLDEINAALHRMGEPSVTGERLRQYLRELSADVRNATWFPIGYAFG